MEDQKLSNPLDKRGLDQLPDTMQDYPGIQADMRPVPDSGEESYKGHGRLIGRKALITGGDSGIGRAIAIAFAREGAEVTIHYMGQEGTDADTLVELMGREGITIHTVPGDLRDERVARQVVRDAHERMNGLNTLVLNAGVQKAHSKLGEITTEQLIKTFTVNVYAPLWMVQEAENLLPKGSSIIFTSSTEWYKPAVKLTEYAASKYAVVGLSRSLAKELIVKGIRVNTVCPGSTWTPLEISGGLLREDIPGHGGGSLMNRPAQPIEIAGAYVFLASEEASFVTCEVYGVSGGMEGV